MLRRLFYTLLFVGSVALLFAMCGGETPPNPARRELVEVVLLSPPTATRESSLFAAPAPSVLDALERLEELRTDEHAVGVFLRIGSLRSAWGRLADVREALAALREAGKPVHCHIESADNAGYLLAASSCDRISITPAGSLDAVGVAAQLFYARDLLSQIGVSAQILRVGEFKNAAEPFTAQEPSAQTLESTGALLDAFQGALVTGIASGRDLSPARVQAILDAGPYDARGALDAGLVDAIEFDDEARTHAREACTATRGRRLSLVGEEDDPDLGEVLSALSSGEASPPPPGRHLVVVQLTGTISDSERAGSGSGQAGPFVAQMRELAEDDDVAAVVLRIDSPGGSALASDRMWHAVRRLAAAKPVIVSVGDVAASGGYYIAAAGHEIFAHETSIVGSIGVFGGKVDLSGLLDRVGVHSQIVSRAEHAAWTSPTQPFTEGEREALQRMMQSTYERFIDRVAAGRPLDRDAVLAIAEGRVWSGRDGLERGLIDRVGGLRAAIAHARERAGLPEDAPIVEWPSRASMLRSAMQAMQGEESSVEAMLRVEGAWPAAELFSFYRLLGERPQVLVMSPEWISVL